MTAPVQIGPYRIVRPLGKGGMGCVYEALHDAVGRRVAIKVLYEQYAGDRKVVTRFFNEAIAANRIEHPSIVQIWDSGHTAEGAAYLVMEYLAGETLRATLDSLRENGVRLPEPTAAQIALQLADALAAAHEKGIVHRDHARKNKLCSLAGHKATQRRRTDHAHAPFTHSPH